jgi:hypothetical protein
MLSFQIIEARLITVFFFVLISDVQIIVKKL